MRMDVLHRVLREQFATGQWFVGGESVVWHSDAARFLVAAGALSRRPLRLHDPRRSEGGSVYEYCLP